MNEVSNNTGIRYACPCCHETLRHVSTETVEGELDGGIVYTYDIHLECMKCPHILSMTVNVPNPLLFRPLEYDPCVRREVMVVDNRDDRTTWLWLNEDEYVEVDPVELHADMLDNCC